MREVQFGSERLMSRTWTTAASRTATESGGAKKGCLRFNPYKGELLPLWRFATPSQAKASASTIWKKFLAYGRTGDFVGMDMARKYLQNGLHSQPEVRQSPGRQEVHQGHRTERPRTKDVQKSEAAEIFRAYWQRALKNRRYLMLRRRYEASVIPS